VAGKPHRLLVERGIDDATDGTVPRGPDKKAERFENLAPGIGGDTAEWPYVGVEGTMEEAPGRCRFGGCLERTDNGVRSCRPDIGSSALEDSPVTHENDGRAQIVWQFLQETGDDLRSDAVAVT
jgi:hypothetical protein